MALACSLMLTLTACGSFPASRGGPAPVHLPAHPARCTQKVPLPKLNAGDDARAVLGRSLGALETANGRIADCDQWYRQVRRDFGKGER